MNYRRVLMAAYAGRIAREWRHLGGFRRAFMRISEIHALEGWSGVLRRFANLRPAAQGPATRATDASPRGRGGKVARDRGVMLVGHPHRVTGNGESLRSMATALAAAGVPFHVRDALGSSARDPDRLTDWPLALRLDDGTHRYRANIFCLNADEMEPALAHLGPGFFKHSYNIGCWWWELSEFPYQWRHAFDYVHEVWAHSHFVRDAISRGAPVPVSWVPHAIEPGPADPAVARDLGVPDERFSFLFFFDFQSYVARKNPRAVIDAFKRAFPHDGEACLVIKTSGSKQRPREFQAFLESIDAVRSSVIVIDRVLSHAQMKGLISGCDCFVSLHRSEGLGLGLAEAMYYGKPTIATAYSGNLDFTRPQASCLVDYRLIAVREGEYPFWEGQVWADPDIDQAARWMRRLYADPEFARQMGAVAQQVMRSEHSPGTVGAVIADRLANLGCL